MTPFRALQDGAYENLLQRFVSLKSSTFVFQMDRKKSTYSIR